MRLRARETHSDPRRVADTPRHFAHPSNCPVSLLGAGAEKHRRGLFLRQNRCRTEASQSHILRAASSGDYGDALAARLAAAGARAAQARRAGRPAVTPERLREMMRIVQDQRRAAALVRSPSPRKTPHKFRGSTIYPPPHVEVPVPTSPGF